MFAINVQRGLAGNQEFELRPNREQLRDDRRRADEMLEVVEQQKHRLVQTAQIFIQRFLWRLDSRFRALPPPARWWKRSNQRPPLRTSGTKQTPPGKAPAISPATCRASRVFPMPPGPVSVTSRASSRLNNWRSAAASCSRPMKAVRCMGRLLARGSERRAGDSPSRSRTAARSRAKSRLEAYRFFGSLARHRSTIQRNGGGTCCYPLAPMRSGSSRRIAANVSAWSSCGMRQNPVTISYSTDPKENWSERKSTSPPSRLLRRHIAHGAHHCSLFGDGRAPRGIRTGAPFPARNFANPKSRTLAMASRETIRFSGFKSRCTMPISCALARASAICAAIVTALRNGIGPADKHLSHRLAIHQFHGNVARAVHLPELINRDNVGMVERAGGTGFLLKARQASGCETRSMERVLMATSRSRRVSLARYTSPIPPAPSR